MDNYTLIILDKNGSKIDIRSLEKSEVEELVQEGTYMALHKYTK